MQNITHKKHKKQKTKYDSKETKIILFYHPITFFKISPPHSSGS